MTNVNFKQLDYVTLTSTLIIEVDILSLKQQYFHSDQVFFFAFMTIFYIWRFY